MLLVEVPDKAHANWVRSVRHQVQEALSGTRAVFNMIDPTRAMPEVAKWWATTNYDLEYTLEELDEIARSLEGEKYTHEPMEGK